MREVSPWTPTSRLDEIWPVDNQDLNATVITGPAKVHSDGSKTWAVTYVGPDALEAFTEELGFRPGRSATKDAAVTAVLTDRELVGHPHSQSARIVAVRSGAAKRLSEARVLRNEALDRAAEGSPFVGAYETNFGGAVLSNGVPTTDAFDGSNAATPRVRSPRTPAPIVLS